MHSERLGQYGKRNLVNVSQSCIDINFLQIVHNVVLCRWCRPAGRHNWLTRVWRSIDWRTWLDLWIWRPTRVDLWIFGLLQIIHYITCNITITSRLKTELFARFTAHSYYTRGAGTGGSRGHLPGVKRGILTLPPHFWKEIFSGAQVSWFSAKSLKLWLPAVRFFTAKMYQIRFRLRLRPRLRWGSLQCSPRPLAGFKGASSKCATHDFDPPVQK